MATTVKQAQGHPVEKTLYATLGAVERAGKEIAHLAHEGRKRVKAHERKVIVPARTPKKVARKP